jgi:membrane fusion protein
MSDTHASPAAAPEDDFSGRPLFPARPPNAVALSIGTLLVALFAVVVAVAFLVRFPDTVRSPFVLVPEGGADPVRAPRAGTVTEILVTETQDVRKGQDLFVLRSQEIRAWTSELRTLQQDLAASDERLALLDKDHRAELDIQDGKIQQLEKDLAFQQEYLKTLREFLARYEQLDSEGLVPRVDIMAQRLAASKGERDVAMTREARDMAALEMVRIRNDYRHRVDDLRLDKRKTQLRIAALEKLLENAQEDVVRVTAPFDGTVVAVQRKNAGDVVSYGEELCRIARSDSVLIGQLLPPEDGLPRLAVGQRVQLLYQAYPYERFGTGRGTLRWISPAAVSTTGGDRFVAHATLDGPTLGPTSAGRALRAGMRGEARVLVGRRTLVEFVVEPLRRLRENVAVQP